MENKEIKELQNKIIEGLKIASENLIKYKKKNKQKMVVFTEGKIQVIKP
jgi:hypothetical protein